MVKIKQYALPIVLALSLFINFMFLNQVNNMSTSLNSLRALVESQSITLTIYNDSNQLVETISFEIETGGVNLETHLFNLKRLGELEVGIESTPIGAWVSSISGITPKENQYWGILSSTNGACKMAANNPENYSKLDGYCSKGISEIFVESGDVFIFKLLNF